MDNLGWLAAAFSIAAVFYILAWVVIGQMPGLRGWNVFIAIIGETLSAICILFFTHATFYQGRSSPRWIYATLTILAAVGVVWFNLQNLNPTNDADQRTFFQLGMTMMVGVAKFFPWSWHLWAGWQSYAQVSVSQDIENWIKGRYRLVIGYSIAMVTGSLILLAAPLLGFNVANSLTGLTLIFAIVPQFLAWVMPEPYRKWLNRAPRVVPKAQPQQRPQLMITALSTAMIQDSPVTSMACHFAIRQTISQIIGSEDAKAIDQYLQTMGYNEWESLLRDTGLRQLLINSGATDVNLMLQRARNILIEKQSLLTMTVQ
ncbi:MAG: hypothetical protein AB1894_02230 [Chloroflexota bacterium]